MPGNSNNNTVEPFITNTIGNQHFVPYSVTNSGTSGIFLVGVALHNRAVECNVTIVRHDK